MGTRRLGFSAFMTAAYARLRAALPPPPATIYVFYNYVPRGATMPYHVIGQPLGRESLSFNTRDTEAEELVIQIDSWVDETSGKGDKPCADMMDEIVWAMTDATVPFTIIGTPTHYDNPYLLFLDFANILKDDTEPGKIIRHGTLRFRAETAPK